MENSQKETKAHQLRAPQAKNPDEDRLKQQQTELDQLREQIFRERVDEKITSTVNAQFTRVVDQYSKKNKW